MAATASMQARVETLIETWLSRPEHVSSGITFGSSRFKSVQITPGRCVMLRYDCEMRWMALWLVCACGSSNPDDAETKEMIFEDTFEVFPGFGWTYSSGTPGRDLGTLEVGETPPAAFMSNYVSARITEPFPFASQSLDLRLDASIVISGRGGQSLDVSVLVDSFRVGGIVFGYVWEGATDEMYYFAACDFGSPTGRVHLEHSDAFFPLHIVVDELGARCGVNGEDLATDPDLHIINGNMTFELEGIQDETQGAAYFDNLKLLRGL
jgi:hypothetical protein